MFRDPSYFRAMREKVAPHLRTYPSLKVWIAGCSSGEELYSLVILFREEGLESRTLFYATDINQDALAKAAARHLQPRPHAGVHRKSPQVGRQILVVGLLRAAYGGASFDKIAAPTRRVLRSQSRDRRRLRRDATDILPQCADLFRPRLAGSRAWPVQRLAAAQGLSGSGSKESLRFSRHADAFTEFVREEKIYQKRDMMSDASAESGGDRRLGGRSRGLVVDFAGAARRLRVAGHDRGSCTARQEQRSRPICSRPNAPSPVREAEDKEPIRARERSISRPPIIICWWRKTSRLSLSNEEPVHYSRPSIDVLFESAADAYGPQSDRRRVDRRQSGRRQRPGRSGRTRAARRSSRTPHEAFAARDAGSRARRLPECARALTRRHCRLFARRRKDMIALTEPVHFLLVDDLEENLLSLEALLRRDGARLVEGPVGRRGA